eukprot:TRINITY_DN47786_c0_g1_i1.p1 TRINITY_DN47786_c0_g1~~TRINITY_DN47786_c0_g1_i1.p1  ORF type:complete len:650 (-),score=130.04 TRINITY_DN47786_c0_g1_i1:75-2024(-)
MAHGIRVVAPGERDNYTEFFRGLIGRDNVFASFEKAKKPQSRVRDGEDRPDILRRLPAGISAETTVVRCEIWGCARPRCIIQFQVDEETLNYLQNGKPLRWRPIKAVKAVYGNPPFLPTSFFTGVNAEKMGWILGCGDKHKDKAVASSVSWDSDWDKCFGQELQGDEMVSLSFKSQEPIIVGLRQWSRYANAAIDEDGAVLDSSDPLNVKNLASLEVFKEPPFPGCRIDQLGNILSGKKKVEARTTDFEELGDFVGYLAVKVGACRKKAGEFWGWPPGKTTLRTATGQPLLDDEADLTCSSLVLAFRAPWFVTATMRLPGDGGVALSAEGLGKLATGKDCAERKLTLEVDIPSLNGSATLSALKRALVRRVALPMEAFLTYPVPKPPPPPVPSAPAAGGYADEEAKGTKKKKKKKKEDEGPPPGPDPNKELANTVDLDALDVSELRLELREDVVRLLVELRNRDELWYAARTAKRDDPLAYLEPWKKDVGFTLARQMYTKPCLTHDSVVVLQFDWSQDNPLKWRAGLRGPFGSAYEGGVFWLDVTLPVGWPQSSPRCRFMTPVYHCNICEDGTVPEGALGLLETEWKPTSTVFCYLAAVFALLGGPVVVEGDSAAAARADLAAQFLADPAAYHDAARRWTRQHASAQPP